MTEAPQVVEYYRETISPDPEVDMIFVSQDPTAEGLGRWTTAHRPPYAILSLAATADRERVPTLGRHIHTVTKVNRMMPAYLLVDSEGDIVVDPQPHWNNVRKFLEEERGEEEEAAE